MRRNLGLLSVALVASLGLAACSDDDGQGNNNNNVAPTCGNGVAEQGETCDGTDLDGQSCASVPGGFTGGTLGCNATCDGWVTAGCTTTDDCGNGALDTGETCDGSNLDGNDCTTIGQGFTGGTLACNGTCTGWNTTACTTANECGNGMLDGGEVCDGNLLDGNDCTTIGQGFTGGTLACNATCDDWDTTGCVTELCGNGDIDGVEECDGGNLGGEDCTTIGMGYTAGTLACAGDCTFDTSACLALPDCGNDALDTGEICDGAALGGEDCTSVPGGFTGGALGCADDCAAFDTSACTSGDPCGNGFLDGGELCDGALLDGNTCASIGQGFTGGQLTCNATCDGWVTTACTTGNPCGNGFLDGAEVCDGANLNGASCTTIPGGYTGGVLTCRADCSGYNVGGCTGGTPAVCGNGVAEAGEVCDGADLVGQGCVSQGYDDGNLYCAADCQSLVLSGCYSLPATCGNDLREWPETCDGTDLQNATCASLGFTGGTLGCTEGCRWDLSQCTGDLCDLQGWYGDGYCDPCEHLGGTADSDCSGCSAADGYCISWVDPSSGLTSCVLATGAEDPDCGTCGDGAVSGNGAEQCDGADLDGATCESFGFGYGALACASNCTYDVSGCFPSVCGDGLGTGTETCDGTDLRGNDCGSIGLGFNQGALACTATCDGWDTTNCSAGCQALYLGAFSGTPLTYTGSTCTGSSAYSPTTTACTGYGAQGFERVFEIIVPASTTVAVSLQAVEDSALYVLTDCLDFEAATCVAGSDDYYLTGYESLTLNNTDAIARSFFVVADTYAAGACGDFTLVVAADFCGNGLVEDEIGETCDDGNTVSWDLCSSTCEIEPMDVFTGPGTLASYPRAITVAGEVDRYQIDVTAPCYLRAETFAPAAGSCTSTDTIISLLDASDVELGYDDDDGTGNCSLITPTDAFARLDIGTYYLTVEEYGNNAAIPAYELQLSCLEADVCGNGIVEAGEQCDDGNVNPLDGCSATCQNEPPVPETEANDSAATANALGNIGGPGAIVLSGAFAVAGDNDWFTFTLTAPLQVQLTTYTTLGQVYTSCTIDTVMWLYNGIPTNLTATTSATEPTIVAYDDDDGYNACSQIQGTSSAPLWVSLPAGTYYVRAKLYSGTATAAQYYLRVAFQ